MISVTEAEAAVLSQAELGGVQTRSLDRAAGCVLREEVRADRDHPPADFSSMDGIAVAYACWRQGQRRFRVGGVQRAGIPALEVSSEDAVEIMTGALLPAGLDTVIPVEDLEIKDGWAQAAPGITVAQQQYVRRKGCDYQQGARLLSPGLRLGPAEAAVAAAAGRSVLNVSRAPRIAVLGTGDELVDVTAPVLPYQFRRSNALAVQTALVLHGFSDVTRQHLPDNVTVLQQALEGVLNSHELLILSGGVSMGRFDFVPDVLKRLGVKPLFHKVAQRPGKPFWFGMKEGIPVFALPGNPVSTLMCFYRYVLPFLWKVTGWTGACDMYVRVEGAQASAEATRFVPVQRMGGADGAGRASAVAFTGSGDYAALSRSDGFVEIPPGHAAETPVRFFGWRV